MKSRLCQNCHQYHSRTYSASNLKKTSVYKFTQLFGKYEGHDSTLNMTQSRKSNINHKNRSNLQKQKIIDESFYQTKKILEKTIESSKKRMQTLYQQSPFKKYLIYKQNSGKFIKERCLTECTDQKIQKPLPDDQFQSNFRSVKKLKVDTPNKKILSKTSIMKIYDQERKKSRTKYTIAKQKQKNSSLKSKNRHFQHSQVQIHKFHTQEPQQQRTHIFISEKNEEYQQQKMKKLHSQQVIQRVSKASNIKYKKLLKIQKPTHYSTFFDNRCCGIECDQTKDMGQIVFDLQRFKVGKENQYIEGNQFFL